MGRLISRRDKIIDTAMRLFYRQGYHRTGIMQIREQAGVTTSGFFYHFSSKADLAAAVAKRYKQLLPSEVFLPMLRTIGDPVERVFAVIDGYREILEKKQFSAGCPMGRMAMEISDSNPKAATILNEAFSAWVATVKTWLLEAADRFPPETDLAKLAMFVLVTMEGAVMLSRSTRNFDPFDESVEELQRYFELLCAKARGRKKKREVSAEDAEGTKR